MKPKTISERTWHGSQDWNHELIEQIGEKRVRYRVKLDSYTSQSYARVSVWRNEEWSQIQSIAGEELKLPFGAYSDGIRATHFSSVVKELRRVAEGVLGL